ncbi:helix-turn-helix domain-containing protein [Saccharothrix xinjiangensis]|uniref:MarR family winged helix-turn-helix transcriptional regulator n=1 Tax=Saccharothrix xinjiangensis TaxID=204798 RepID=A0ABV9Y6Y0_9PSEU
MDHRSFLGTRLRHLLDQLDGDIARIYTDLGLPDFRPRYTPIIQLVHTHGPRSIRWLADTIGITHSAVSQTVNQMRRDGLVDLVPGEDARQRLVHLTDHAHTLKPTLDAEWQATNAATLRFDAELPHSLSDTIDAALRALADKPMRDRIHEHLDPPPTEPTGKQHPNM